MRLQASVACPACSFPFQRAFFPLIDESHDENGEKHQHGEKAEGADFMQNDRPWKQEGYFQIEQDEQYRHKIVAHVELHACVFKCLETTFVRRKLFRIGVVNSKQSAQSASGQW